ncbi:MAG TPA: ABC transporter substrate-binding protein [Xanthobacteraceae bacterium]|nr:ABC transporter substrate-binding protein [Xanthobacteraceae bacterium]
MTLASIVTTTPRLFAAAFLVAAALAAPCRAPAAETITIRIGYAAIGVDNRPFAEGTSAATARAGNYLEEEFKDDPGIKIEWYFFKGAGPAVNEAFASNQLDFAYQGDLPSIIGRANGLKTRFLIASGARKPLYLAVPKGSSISGVADLKGRKVAIFRGTNGHLAAVKILEAHGLTEKDIQGIMLDQAATAAALASKDIDAAFGDTPLIHLAENGIADIVYTTKGKNPAFARNAGVIAREAFIEAHPEITQRVVNAFVKAALWSSLEQNRAALLELWAKSGTPVSVLAEFFAGDTLAYRNSPLIDPLLVAQYREQADKAIAFGLIRRKVDLTGWFEPKYLETALKSLGLKSTWTSYRADGTPQQGS